MLKHQAASFLQIQLYVHQVVELARKVMKKGSEVQLSRDNEPNSYQNVKMAVLRKMQVSPQWSDKTSQ